MSIEVSQFTQEGKDAGKAKVSEAVFGLKWNGDLVHQVAVGMLSNRRISTAHTKDRSEVSGTGKKPWRQKGTGNARHGSRRSPIWVGGGVAHGPRSEKDFSKKINKKMRNKALFIALSRKVRDGQVLFVDSLSMEEIKTKTAQGIVTALSQVSGFETLDTKTNPNNIFFVFPTKNETLEKSFNNLPNVTFDEVRNLNLLDVVNHRYLVIVDPKMANESLESRLTKKVEATKKEA